MLLAVLIISTFNLALILAAVLNVLIAIRLVKFTTTKATETVKTKASNWLQPLLDQSLQKTLAEMPSTNGNTPAEVTTNA